MKGISIDMQIECDCGELLAVEQPIEGQPPMLKELRYKCSGCGTGYFIHIQEIKKPACDKYKVIV